MDTLETLTQAANISGIPKTFGLNVESLLILIFGSIIVGYICLTFYYKIYQDNKRWTDLDYSEKAIISFVIGFFSILSSIYIITVYRLSFPQLGTVKNEYLEQFFLQLMYIMPFLYFIGFSVLTSKSNFVELDFIKKYINWSSNIILIFNLMFISILFYLVKDWRGLGGVFLLFLIYLGLHKIEISTLIDKTHWSKSMSKLKKDDEKILYHIYKKKYMTDYKPFRISELISEFIGEYNGDDIIDVIESLVLKEFIVVKMKGLTVSSQEVLTALKAKPDLVEPYERTNDLKLYAPDHDKITEIKELLIYPRSINWLKDNFFLTWQFIWKHFIITIIVSAVTTYIITKYITS